MATRFDPAQDHDPLFPAPIVSSSGEKARRRTVPSVTRGKCPDCANDKTIGLVRQGDHLAWRLHTRRTLSGATLECRASGVPLCQAAARPEAGVITPSCKCGGSAE